MRQLLPVLAFWLLVTLLPTNDKAAAGKGKVGIISSVAGTGAKGFRGDGGKGSAAQLNMPFHCDLDADANLFIVDTGNNRIRKLNLKTGLITTVAGNGQDAFGAKGEGELKGDGGSALKAAVSTPYAVAVDANGDLYIVEQRTTLVRKVDGKSGIISTVAGTGTKGFSGDGGPGAKAMLREPNDCFLDGKGGLLIADVQDWRIRRLDLKTGLITTFAGIGRPKDLVKVGGRFDRTKIGDFGKATDAVLIGARAVCVDGKGNTFICEREGNAIRKVDAKGIITTWAGTGEGSYTGDGQNKARATFKNPKGIRCDAQGNVYLVDSDNRAIRKIDVKTNMVTTVAGGRLGGEGDGGVATKAGLDAPHGCLVGPDGTLFIADTGNHRVRAVSPP